MLVYCATNIINNKKYVGFTTKTLEQRKNKHYSVAFNKIEENTNYFKQSIKKYGKDNFNQEIIQEYDTYEEALEGEIFQIKELNTLAPNGYNLTTGGFGGATHPDTKLKISNSLKEHYKLNPISKDRFTHEQLVEIGLKGQITKRAKGYIPAQINQSEESKKNMSKIISNKFKVNQFNTITQEKIELSIKDMEKYCNLSQNILHNIKHNRLNNPHKSGWVFIKTDNNNYNVGHKKPTMFKWLNIITNEEIEMTINEMSIYTGINTSSLQRIKRNIIKEHKSGQTILNGTINEVKNIKKIKQYNTITKGQIEMTINEMSQYSGINISTLYHIKQNIKKNHKSGWIILNENT